MKCAYEDRECSRDCIHTKTCARWKLRNGKGPCKDCGRRSITCHTDCQDYKEWSEATRKKNAEIYKKKKLELESNEMKKDGIKRMKTRKRTKVG